jgi:hypothetical protein
MTTPTTPLKRVPDPRHVWLSIQLGRICQVCYLTQASGEYDDGAPCAPPGAERAVGGT